MSTWEKLLEEADRDPFVRCFIIDAVMKQARGVAASDGKEWPKDCLIAWPLWLSIADRITECEII